MAATHDVLEFVLGSTEERVIVYDERLRTVYQNERAARFFAHHELPRDILALVAKVFGAIKRDAVDAECPGRLALKREIAGRPWFFRLSFRAAAQPLVCVFFRDESVSDRFDLGSLRQQYRLTRREADLMAHLLDGMNNREIAEDLCITEQTVKDHLGNIYRKIGVQDRYGLLRHLIAAHP